MCSPNLIAILQWAKLEKNSTKNNVECLAKLRITSKASDLINGNNKASTICIFLLIFYSTVNTSTYNSGFEIHFIHVILSLLGNKLIWRHSSSFSVHKICKSPLVYPTAIWDP